MKTIKQILEQYDTLTNKKTNENQKLVELVREGLLDESKLPLVERALTLDAELITTAERGALVDLLESLSTFFFLEKKDEKKIETKMKDYDKDDANQPSNKQVPMILVFQRKAIRVFPDNLRVATYYSQALDKYITIPFGPKSAEAITNINEGLLNEIGNTSRGREALQKYVDKGGKRGVGSRQDRAGRTDSVFRHLQKRSASSSWQSHRDDEEDAEVTKHTNPETAKINAKLRDKERSSQVRQGVRDRIDQSGSHSDMAKIKGGTRMAANRAARRMSGQDPLLAVGAAAGAAASVGARKVGNWIKNKISEERNRLSEEALQESGFAKFKPFKASGGTKKKTTSLSKMFGSSKKKEPAKKAEKTPETKSENKSASPAPKKENTSDTVKKYIKAYKDHANSTGTSVRVWDSDKGKHKDIDSKKMLGDYKERLASKIRASGGTVPDVPEQERVKRSPGRKPPPALAEQEINEIGPIVPLAMAGARMVAPHVARGAGALLRGAKRLLGKKPKTPGKSAPKTKLAAATGSGAAAGAAAGAASSSSSSSSAPQSDFTDRGGNRRSGSVQTREKVPSASKTKAYGRIGGSAVDVNESHLSQIKALVESGNSSLNLTFGEHQISINNRIGKKLLTVYESLNQSNKKKVEDMLNESADSFRKVINFVVRQ